MFNSILARARIRETLLNVRLATKLWVALPTIKIGVVRVGDHGMLLVTATAFNAVKVVTPSSVLFKVAETFAITYTCLVPNSVCDRLRVTLPMLASHVPPVNEAAFIYCFLGLAPFVSNKNK